MTTPRRDQPGRGTKTVEPTSTTTVPPAYITEATARLEAAASVLSYALLGEVAHEVAAGSAIRLIEGAQRHLKAAA
jgi:hypothetical protein